MRKIRFRFGYRSLHWNMTLAFSLLIFLCVNGVGYLAYYKYSEGAEESARNFTYDIVEQVNRNAEYYIKYMEDISNLTYFNKDIQAFLSQPVHPDDYRGQIRRALDRVEIGEYFNSFLSIRQDIVSIYIFGENGEVLTNRTNFHLKDNIRIEDQPWYRKAAEAGGRIVISPTHVRNFTEDGYEWVVSLSRKINHLDTKKNLGVFLIDLNFRVIQEICGDVNLGSPSGYVFIVDRDGELVYHPQQQLIYSNVKHEDFDLIMNTDEKFVTSTISGREKLYSIISSDVTGWKVVAVTYTDELVPNRDEFRNFIIALSVGSIPLTFLLSTVVASRISRPIKRLEHSMRLVEQGELDAPVELEGSREVVQLSRTFQLMLKRIRQLMQQVVEEQELKRRSELKALQAQINPHFLYNTLDLVIWMTQRGRKEEVIHIVSSLSRLFRISISKGEEMATVKDEVEHIKHYLLIQKYRYKNKLNYVIDVEQDILRYRVPRLILQPLVENAIYHGIKPQPEGGTVRIRGHLGEREGQPAIVLEVSDDGVGMPPDRLQGIFAVSERGLRGGGVGVSNIQERIRLYAGAGYGLEFAARPGGGTVVTVVLPVWHNKREGSA